MRHGESEANKALVFAGCGFNAQLDEKGVEQARRFAEYAVKNYQIDAVYTSPLDRAYNTANACARLLGLEPIICEGVREIYAGAWEGMLVSDIRNKYPEEFSVWCNDIANCRCTDGESVREMGERVMKALVEIAEANDGKTVVVASHYTPTAAVQTYAMTGDFNIINGTRVPNASITEVYYDNGKWSPGNYSIDSYLDGHDDNITIHLSKK